MKALIINCTLKPEPQPSNTYALAEVVAAALREKGVEVEHVRASALNLPPGVRTDEGPGDDWPDVHRRLLESAILVVASPTWLGRPSSYAQLILERMDAMISETGPDDRPVAYGRVAGVVVTGNEDGAHHVVSEICGALGDIGYTIPGQAWTYWHLGPGPGPDYLDDQRGHEWSDKTGRQMAQNLYVTAQALARDPATAPSTVPPPSSGGGRPDERS